MTAEQRFPTYRFTPNVYSVATALQTVAAWSADFMNNNALSCNQFLIMTTCKRFGNYICNPRH